MGLGGGIAVGIDVGWHRGQGSPPIAVGIDVGINVGWHRDHHFEVKALAANDSLDFNSFDLF